MKYSAEQLSVAGDKYLGRPYSEMDCQKFVEKCMADVGYHRDLPGSNAWYRACDWTGTPEECIREFGCIPNGALLFILKDDGKEPDKYKPDGIGNASHIGIYTGRGDGAIHSSQSKGCVTNSVFNGKTIPNGGWNRVGLLRDFDYGNSVNWILDHDGGDNETMKEGIVSAENGKPVNLRKSPSKAGALIDKIPCGTPVEIIADEGEWCKISVNGKEGWMMSMFIRTEDGTGDFTVTIPHLSEAEADELLKRYPGAVKEQERG